MNLKPLKSERDFENAVKLCESFMDAKEGTIEATLAEALAILIEKYEDEHYPIDPPDPIEAIKFRMEQMGLEKRDMIKYLGSSSRVSEIFRKKRQLSINMIRKLHEELGIPLETLVLG
ncbi:MAG: transcriptional regulator [Bacteroidetes bacterium]|nr:transcriptional regulator [Bacteroidota bacterium]